MRRIEIPATLLVWADIRQPVALPCSPWLHFRRTRARFSGCAFAGQGSAWTGQEGCAPAPGSPLVHEMSEMVLHAHGSGA